MNFKYFLPLSLAALTVLLEPCKAMQKAGQSSPAKAPPEETKNPPLGRAPTETPPPQEDAPESLYREARTFKECGSSEVSKEQIMDLYKRAADRGHVRAQFRLAVRYAEQGNHDDAQYYFQLAAEQDHVKASYNLGLYCEGLYCPSNRNLKDALGWHLFAATKGFSDAIKRVAVLLEKETTQQEVGEGTYVEMQYRLAKCYLAEGPNFDEEKGERLLILAARESHVKAQFSLGTHYAKRGDHGAAQRYFQQAEAQNHAKAIYNLGLYREGKHGGSPRNLRHALDCYVVAAVKGLPPALERMAVLLTKEGAQQELGEGTYVEMQYHLAQCYLAKGRTLEALKWLQLAAAKNNKRALLLLARLVMELGGDQNGRVDAQELERRLEELERKEKLLSQGEKNRTGTFFS